VANNDARPHQRWQKAARNVECVEEAPRPRQSDGVNGRLQVVGGVCWQNVATGKVSENHIGGTQHLCCSCVSGNPPQAPYRGGWPIGNMLHDTVSNGAVPALVVIHQRIAEGLSLIITGD
jgi:hypothetical protein